MFSKYHYLTSKLNPSAVCFVGLSNNVPVAFVGVLPNIGHKDMRRCSRVVVLPDYQGVGFGKAVTDKVASLYKLKGIRYTITMGHPGLIKSMAKNKKWKITNIKKQGSSRNTDKSKGLTSTGRVAVSFEYIGK